MFKKLFKKDKKEEKPRTPSPPPAQGGGHSSSKAGRDDYEHLKVLGKGSFAKVVLVREKKTGEYFAMKVVNKEGVLSHKRVQDVFTERNVLNRSQHPFLLKLFHTFQSDTKLFFIMEFMPGGDLDGYMNKLPNKGVPDYETARLYGCEILQSILYLHNEGVIYRDLKPENILMSHEGHCVLADFGLSKDFHKDGVETDDLDMRATSFVGSPFYVAPDVLKQKEYTAAVDFWSFGILLYRMMTGRVPFTGRNMKEVFDNIMFSELRFPSSIPLPNEAKDLISRLLTKDASKRIKGDEVKRHPFWNGLSFESVAKLQVKPLKWVPPPPVDQIVKEANQVEGIQAQQATVEKKAAKDAAFTPSDKPSALAGSEQQALFRGFSYTPENAME